MMGESALSRPEAMWLSVRRRLFNIRELRILASIRGPEDVDKLLADADNTGSDDVQISQLHANEHYFTASEAHALAARTCMFICSRPTAQLVRQKEGFAFTVVSYARESWGSHLFHSECHSNDKGFRGALTSMMPGVCENLLVTLLSLSRPIDHGVQVSATHDEVEPELVIRQVQEESTELIFKLLKLLTGDRYTNTTEAVCRIREQISQGLSSFPQHEEQLLQDMIAISRSLRRLQVFLRPISRQWGFSNQRDTHFSAYDTIAHAAAFFEITVSYPSWETFPDIVAPADIFGILPQTDLPKHHTNAPFPHRPGDPLTTCPSLKTALLASGYRTSLAYLITAILLNHLGCTFTPWLASYIWNTPLEDLRLARSNPDVFLSELLSTPWTLLFLGPIKRYLTTRLFDITTRFAVRSTPTTTHSTFRASLTRGTATLFSLSLHLSNIEYTITLLLHTTATLLSLFSLLTGPPVYQQALYQILSGTFPDRSISSHPQLTIPPLHSVLKILYIAVFLSWNILFEVIPLTFESLRCAKRGRPSALIFLLSTAGFTTMLLRYRSTFFIALQVHRMFVALGLFFLMLGMLYWEYVSDRIQLTESKMRLGQMKVQTRGLVPEETESNLREGEKAGASGKRKAKLMVGRLKED
ncbi:hypothetical protein B0T14DRAFT_565536 [Immersiella caudata]|uniref:Uncharacterized protein n=1 Tax=Immersiella caudata TaxID=314043 RepID=A0AA39WZ03_9PEZI|nr:hypothetical protein B0T14DRAFT_565536 [Immersiella caudata]